MQQEIVQLRAAQQPLVDALTAIIKARDFGHAYDIAQDALVNVKDGK